MTHQTVVEGDWTYTIVLDDAIAVGNRIHAITQARVLDELTGVPISAGITVTPAGAAFQKPAARQNVFSRVASGGLVGLAGVPVTVFPQLQTQAYEVGVTIRAEGYIPVQVTRIIGPQANFPDAFSLAQIGDVALHRTPIILRGRTVRRTSGGITPVAGATVRITGIWRTLPTANVVVPPSPANLVSLTPGLYANRNAGSGAVRTVTLTPTVGEDKQLMEPALAGTTKIRLSNRTNVSVGDVIAIDEGDINRREHLVVTAIEGASSPAQPAIVTLAHPLAVSHARGAVVRKAIVSDQGPTRAVSVDAIPGDVTLFCASIVGMTTPTFVEISGGSSEKEYHWLRPYDVASDANGDYQLPPISRVAQIAIEAQHPPDEAVVYTVGPLYPAREQYVNFTFA
jgi:hypothetical protein